MDLYMYMPYIGSYAASAAKLGRFAILAGSPSFGCPQLASAQASVVITI
jgi:hypothetical protein